tara:strand:+ start:193 stop:513 length:321 start_codon:yes stop_codon:yes gene_type:complete
MNMGVNSYEIFGYLASCNACLMMVPQLLLTLKSKTIKDLSMKTIFLNLLTQSLFLPYSIHFRLIPLMTVNICLAFFDVIIIGYYFYLKNTKEESLLNDIFLDSSNV